MTKAGIQLPYCTTAPFLQLVEDGAEKGTVIKLVGS